MSSLSDMTGTHVWECGGRNRGRGRGRKAEIEGGRVRKGEIEEGSEKWREGR